MTLPKRTQSQEIIATEQWVEQLMIDNPEFRTNENALCCYIWEYEMSLLRLKESRDFTTFVNVIMFSDFVEQLKKKNLTSSESICRNYRTVRRKYLLEWKLPKKKEEQEKCRLIYSKDLFH